MILLTGIRFHRISIFQATIILIVLSFGGEIIIEYTKGGTSSPSVVFCMGIFMFIVLGLPTIIFGKMLARLKPRENGSK